MSAVARRACITIELLDDAVFSERAATAGGHRSLDYVPGAALLGVAAKAYATFDDPYAVFHSGSVRFGNGLPAAGDGAIAVPMPLAWHEAKAGPAGVQHGQCVEKAIWNLQHGYLPDGSQPRQLRDGYVTATGSVLTPSRRFRMKTAIDPQKRRAAEAQLFGYDSLAAGQRFVAEIEADALDDLDWERLKRLLSGLVYLGRSRTAQYGRAQLTWRNVTTPLLESGPSSGNVLTLLALSDIALEDARGVPATTPTGELIGLTGAKWNSAKSFLRFRAYSTYNAFHKRYECERQVIVQGSVICFDRTTAFTDSECESLTTAIGVNRQFGLGRVWVNPDLLQVGNNKDPHPAFASPGEGKQQAADGGLGGGTSIVDSPWVAFLAQRQSARGGLQAAVAAGRQIARDELPAFYRAARSYGGLAPHLAAGPTRSQWRRVADVARQAETADALKDALFTGSQAICRTGDECWALRGARAGVPETYADWLQAHLDTLSQDDLFACDKIASLADAAAQMIQRKELP